MSDAKIVEKHNKTSPRSRDVLCVNYIGIVESKQGANMRKDESIIFRISNNSDAGRVFYLPCSYVNFSICDKIDIKVNNDWTKGVYPNS